MTDPAPFTRGDLVRLTEKYAGTLLRGHRRKKIDWRSRRGVVERCSSSEVYVAWEGRRSLDAIPIRGVEKA